MSAAPYAVRDALLAILPATLTKIVAAGGKAAAEQLTPRTLLVYTQKPVAVFDHTHNKVTRWIADHTATLADQLSNTSRKHIASSLAKSFAPNTTRMLASNDWITEALDAVGSVDRAQNVAEHESYLNAVKGQSLAWFQAQDDGILSGDETKVWHVQPGCCDACDELDDEEVPIDENFSNGDDGPPLHRSCRCEMSLSQG